MSSEYAASSSAEVMRPLRAEVEIGSKADDGRIEQAVVRLNAICKVATMDFALAVGKLIIDVFYDGRPDAWRLREPKEHSLRKLARHPELPMSAGALYRSVAMYEVCARLGIQRWKNVCTSHIRVVLPLNHREQERLLAAVETQGWSVRRLEEEVVAKEHQVDRIDRGGRRPVSQLRKAIQSMERSVEKAASVVDDEHCGPSPESVRTIVAAIERIKQTCTRVEDQIGSTVG